MSATAIEWTDRTWNPVRGCSRVSPGCDHCYAMGQAHRFSGPGGPYEGLTTIRRGKVDWAGSARLVPEQLAAPLSWRKPQRIFVNSMSDLFHESLSNEDIAAVFGVMAACPQHTFQVLTKRPKRMAEWFKSLNPLGVVDRLACIADDATEAAGVSRLLRALAFAPGKGAQFWPLPNVWVGVSVENQEQADKRIPLLLETPAAVRFISAEPLLGELVLENDEGSWLDPECWGDCDCGALYGHDPGCRRNGGDGQLTRKLDWVIVGGESGPGARPCALEWIESIVEQCRAARVACFVKQLGAVVVSEERTADQETMDGFFGKKDRSSFLAPSGEVWAWRAGLAHKKGGDPQEWPEGLRVRQFPGGASA